MRQFRTMLGMLAWMMLTYCQAGIALGATRVIVEESHRDATISVKNTGDAPFLTQSWIQRDDSDRESTATELWVTTPIVRLEGGREVVLHIKPLDVSSLPHDIESLFYLNVQQIPQADTGTEQNKLVLAIRQRIKVFYRPRGLAGSAIEAPTQLVTEQQNDHGVETLKLTNPTSFHLNFAGLTATRSGTKVLESGPLVLAPHATRNLTLSGANEADHLAFQVINDFGAIDGYERTLTAATHAP